MPTTTRGRLNGGRGATTHPPREAPRHGSGSAYDRASAERSAHGAYSNHLMANGPVAVALIADAKDGTSGPKGGGAAPKVPTP